MCALVPQYDLSQILTILSIDNIASNHFNYCIKLLPYNIDRMRF